MSGLEIHRGGKPTGGLVCDRRLYLTSGKDLVVEDGDPRAAFLFATEGVEISAGDVERYGLSVSGGKVVLAGAKPIIEPEAESEPGEDAAGADAPTEDTDADAGGADADGAETGDHSADATPAKRRSKRGRSGGS